MTVDQLKVYIVEGHKRKTLIEFLEYCNGRIEKSEVRKPSMGNMLEKMNLI